MGTWALGLPGAWLEVRTVACPFYLEFSQYSHTLLIKRINHWGLPLGVFGHKGASVVTPTSPVLPGGGGGGGRAMPPHFIAWSCCHHPAFPGR